MNGPSALHTIKNVIDALEDELQSISNEEHIVQAYAAWVCSDTRFNCVDIAALADASNAKDGAGFTHRDVAILGFAYSTSQAASDHHERFRDELNWMKGRKFFAPNRPLSFEVDGLSILGIAVGIFSLESNEEKASGSKWLLEIIDKSLSRAPQGKWETALRKTARALLSDANLSANLHSEIELDLLAALAAKGLVTLGTDVERECINSVVENWDRSDGTCRAITRFFALRWLIRQAANAIPTQATIADLVAILSAVPRALRRWTWETKARSKRAGSTALQWDIQNEYHVQNLLWAILAPIFPDLEDEEWLQSVGHKHPRCDLAIPSLRTIIEVKFVYGGAQSDFAKVTEEVAADSSLYLRDTTRFSQIIAFIWDNSRSSEEHDELKQGLLGVPGITDVVVISRPGWN